MDFTGWKQEDFDVFHLDGFDERMAGIRERILPKLDAIGRDLVSLLLPETGLEWYYHVAKHMRRSVHPPADTWVALNRIKRGYKATVHFGVGISARGSNVCLVVKPECVERRAFASAIDREIGVIRPLLAASGNLYIGDVPNAALEDLMPARVATIEDWLKRAEWLRNRKQYEFEMGCRMSPERAIGAGGDGVVQASLESIREMLPLYQAAIKSR